MFSSILTQASGLFDRRALVNVFFPVLVFWGLLTGVVISEIGWGLVLDRWNHLSVTAQVVFAVGCVGWAALWAFLVIALRPQRIRCFEGYWPSEGWVGAPWRWRQGRWQAWMADRSRINDGLGEEQSRVADESAAWQSVNTLEGNGAVADRSVAQHIAAVTHELATLDAETSKDSIAGASLDRLRELRAMAEYVAGVTRGPDGAEARRRLAPVADRVMGDLDRRFRELRARRAAVDVDLLLLLPPSREEVMPTRLGNVLKAAEVHGRERYGLDSVTVWPRLYPLLPSTVIDDFEDALASLDLMTLLCVLMVAFGLPISVLAAAGPALPLSVGLRVLLGTVMAAAFLLLASLCYDGAVQAAVAYGEKIKAVIDVYRGLLLKELNIQRPNSRREEKALWAGLCAFLYRGDEPTTTIVVPSKTMPAFTPIADVDIERAVYAWSELPAAIVRSRSELIGRLSLVDLPARQPVPCHVLVERAAIEDRVAVTIQSQSEAGAVPVRMGDRVDVLLVPRGGTGMAHHLHTFSDLLVLGIGVYSDDRSPSNAASSKAITLAIPIDQRDEFIRECQAADAVVTVRLQAQQLTAR